MKTSPSIRDLPDKFQTIRWVRSIELRLELTATVASILNLTAKQDALAPDPKTKRLVDRFFAYLTKSCKVEKDINHRALWLCKFAHVIEIHLLAIETKRVQHVFTEGPLNGDPLSKAMIHLASAITAYMVSSLGRQEVNAQVREVVLKIFHNVGMLLPDPHDSSYIQLTESVTALTSTLTVLTQCHDAGSDHKDWWLMRALTTIDNDLNTYILHTGHRI